jgi:hypothetical protein
MAMTIKELLVAITIAQQRCGMTLPNGVAEAPQKLLMGQGMTEDEALAFCTLERQNALRAFDNLPDAEKAKLAAEIRHNFTEEKNA